MTDYQLLALTDLRDGKPQYGIKIRGRNSLPSLYKRGFVCMLRMPNRAIEWQITAQGLEILKQHMPHLFELTE